MGVVHRSEEGCKVARISASRRGSVVSGLVSILVLGRLCNDGRSKRIPADESGSADH